MLNAEKENNMLTIAMKQPNNLILNISTPI